MHYLRGAVDQVCSDIVPGGVICLDKRDTGDACKSVPSSNVLWLCAGPSKDRIPPGVPAPKPRHLKYLKSTGRLSCYAVSAS